MTPALRVEGLQKRFGGVQALRGANLSVHRGELVGLFGPNGAGKTTLFNLIAGSFAPDAGQVVLDGTDITPLPSWRRARLGLGRTFQIARPFRELSVLENVLAAQPGSGSNGAAAARRCLEHVGLAARAGDPAGDLTLGMLKRLELARALALRPHLLILDEPLAGLTGREAADLLAFIGTLRSQAGIVIVEHNVRQCLPACDRALVLDAGQIIAEGAPDAIRTDPAVIRAYLGEDAG